MPVRFRSSPHVFDVAASPGRGTQRKLMPTVGNGQREEPSARPAMMVPETIGQTSTKDVAMDREQLVADFQEKLDDNRRQIDERRKKLIAETGHSMPANRRRYLRKLAIERLRAQMTSKKE